MPPNAIKEKKEKKNKEENEGELKERKKIF